MSVLDAQALLARLYTDENLLAEFLADRDGFCRRMAGGAADFLEQIDGRQLEYFARSLRAKRTHEARKQLPLVAAALGREFHEVFQRHAATCIPSGARKHAADAMAFCEYLLKSAPSSDPRAREAARFERLRLGLYFKLSRAGVQPVVCQARVRRAPWFHMARLAYNLPAQMAPTDRREPLHQRPTWTLFINVPGLNGIWYW